jgi:FAD:protein FMN transferase
MNLIRRCRSRRRRFLAVVMIIVLLLSITGCSQETVEPVNKTSFVLDTLCSITIYDKSTDKMFEDSFGKLSDIDDKMSAQKSTSEVSLINKNAGIKPVKVSEETYKVISEGIAYSKLTDGKFDITVGPLVKLWGINTPKARVPRPEEIKAALPLIGYKNVVLNDGEKSVMLKKKGMSLDLGGIAKGYAGDAVEEILKAAGVKHAIIDLGGNILTIGSKPDKSEWRVGVQNPNKTRGDSLGVVSVSEESVVTSGIYERYFIKNNKRYHHIMDTKTGYPVDNEVASVTIVTEKSMRADALAKAFCMGVNKGLKFIEGQKDVEAIFVTKDSKVYITPGLKNKFEITDASFKLMQ